MTPYQLTEFNRCKNDIVYFVENYLFYRFSQNKMKLSKVQARILRRASTHRNYLAKTCRQFGKSTLIVMLAIHSLIFGKDETIIVASTKNKESSGLADMCNDLLEFLPLWLGRLVERRGRTTRRYGNNTLKFVSSHPTICGIVPTLLLLDDLAFFDEEFWHSIWPVTASGKNTRTKIFSTPSNRDDIVTRLYDAAYEGRNNFVTDVVS